MTTTLYLIRHGLTEWNVTNRFQGSSDIPLCDKGREQAKRLSKRMENYPIHKVYASDLSRAYETAQYIAQPHNIAVKKVPELREIHFGIWEGLTQEEIVQLKEYNFTAWKQSPHDHPFPGEESFKNVQKRVMAGLEKITKNNQGENIAIVSHGGSLKLIIISLLNLPLSFYRSFWLGNTSLSIIELRKDRNVLSLLNDTSHLEDIMQ